LPDGTPAIAAARLTDVALRDVVVQHGPVRRASQQSTPLPAGAASRAMPVRGHARPRLARGIHRCLARLILGRCGGRYIFAAAALMAWRMRP
jgi:hypothetical protein